MGRSSDDDHSKNADDGKPQQVTAEYDTSHLDAELGEKLRALKVGANELFLQATEQTRMAIVVVDPHSEDQPIVYVNRAFVELTGYQREDAIGHNCRFLQGPDTDREAVANVRKALDEERVAVVQLLNYRKDGTPFWNSLHIGPVYDENGELAYYYGSQWDVTNRIEAELERQAQFRAAAELQHRVQNLFAVMTAIVRISARGEEDAAALSDKIISRIEALGRSHRASIAEGGQQSSASGMLRLAQTVLEPYTNAEAHDLTIEGEDFHLAGKMVTPIGIALHELATNAIKYGALGPQDGSVKVSWREEDDDLHIDWIETKAGVDTAKPTPAPSGGSGARIVEGVLGSLGGNFSSDMTPSGYRATIKVPLSKSE